MSLKNTVYDAINSNKFGKAFLKARRDLRGDEAVQAFNPELMTLSIGVRAATSSALFSLDISQHYGKTFLGV